MSSMDDSLPFNSGAFSLLHQIQCRSFSVGIRATRSAIFQFLLFIVPCAAAKTAFLQVKSDAAIDNPDQRICDDVRYTSAFVWVLYNVSNFLRNLELLNSNTSIFCVRMMFLHCIYDAVPLYFLCFSTAIMY